MNLNFVQNFNLLEKEKNKDKEYRVIVLLKIIIKNEIWGEIGTHDKQ